MLDQGPEMASKEGPKRIRGSIFQVRAAAWLRRDGDFRPGNLAGAIGVRAGNQNFIDPGVFGDYRRVPVSHKGIEVLLRLISDGVGQFFRTLLGIERGHRIALADLAQVGAAGQQQSQQQQTQTTSFHGGLLGFCYWLLAAGGGGATLATG